MQSKETNEGSPSKRSLSPTKKSISSPSKSPSKNNQSKNVNSSPSKSPSKKVNSSPSKSPSKNDHIEKEKVTDASPVKSSSKSVNEEKIVSSPKKAVSTPSKSPKKENINKVTSSSPSKSPKKENINKVTPSSPSKLPLKKENAEKMSKSVPTTANTSAIISSASLPKESSSFTTSSLNYYTRRGNATIDSTPILSTQALVQKWEVTKKNVITTTPTKTKTSPDSKDKISIKDNEINSENINSTSVAEIQPDTQSTPLKVIHTDNLSNSKILASPPITPSKKSNATTSTHTRIMEETKLTDNLPRINRKFSFKENRIRENAKRYNKKANTVNIDLMNQESTSASTVNPRMSKEPIVIKSGKKRVFVEDETTQTRKSKRSKRLSIGEIAYSEVSLWQKISSSFQVIKDSLKINDNEEEDDDEEYDDEEITSSIEEEEEEEDRKKVVEEKEKEEKEEEERNKRRLSKEKCIAPTIKEQNKSDLVRFNEPTCLNIFKPNVRSSMPMHLRLNPRRRRTSKSYLEAQKKHSIFIPFFSKTNVKPNWTNKMYMVIGNELRQHKLIEVPAHWTSLSSQLVYILDLSGEALIQFNGNNSQKIDKEYAQRICRRIMFKESISDLFELEQEDSYVMDNVQKKMFWRAMDLDDCSDNDRKRSCVKNDRINLSIVLEEERKTLNLEKAIYIYRINEQTKSLDLIHNGTFPTYKCLNSSVSMIFDFIGEVYLWQGKNSSLNARSLGIKYAQKIFSDYLRPSWSSLKKVNEGHEPVLFQEKFEDSYLFF